jgi:hypothetical protein
MSKRLPIRGSFFGPGGNFGSSENLHRISRAVRHGMVMMRKPTTSRVSMTVEGSDEEGERFTLKTGGVYLVYMLS